MSVVLFTYTKGDQVGSPLALLMHWLADVLKQSWHQIKKETIYCLFFVEGLMDNMGLVH